MKKRILILGGARGQVDIIKKVKELGHYAIVASIPGNFIGLALADEVFYIDISDPKAVSNCVRDHQIDAVVTACLDTGIPALGRACEDNGLVGLSAETAKISANKLLMKQMFMENGVSTAKYMVVRTAEDADMAKKTLSFPLIIKAVDLQGSRGINIVEDPKDFDAMLSDTMNETKEDYCIVEEFIVGYEFGAQAFVYGGEILFIMPAGDITFRSGTNVPVGHYVPMNFNEETTARIEEQVTRAIKAIKLDNCAVNVDLLMRDGEIFVIELTGRIGANCLSQLTSIYYNIDINKMIVEAALGINPKPYFEATAKPGKCGYAKMLFSMQSGVVKKIENKNQENPNIYEITLWVDKGDLVNQFKNSKNCIGQVVVTGDSMEECESLMEEVLSNIVVELE
ncbi:MAG: ATP-grasp domain-containing protein [Clostridia bacterium]|nr:ATP-grasp domain-containing protein [Clostridia bacterium]